MTMPDTLDRVRLGKTDLHVTRHCQGTAFRHLERHAEEPAAQLVLRHCLDIGINFFDTAQAYGWGGSEALLGKTIADRRTDCVICTKVPPSLPPKKTGESGERAVFTKGYLSDQLESSLRRLQTDYVDLYLLHSPDGRSDWEEICTSMDQLKVSGKIRYWGLSNHDSEMVESCICTAHSLGVSGPAVLEEYYTIAGYALSDAGRSRVRKLEQELFPVARQHSLGVMAFSPLDAGHLSERTKPNSHSALSNLHDALDQAAAELDISRTQVCVAWVMSHQEVSAVLSGPEQPEHVDEMLAGLEVTLPSETLNSLNEASLRYANRIEAEYR